MVKLRIILLIIVFAAIINFVKANNSTCFQPYCHCKNLNILVCDNFTSFDQLELCSSDIIWKSVEFIPKNQVDFNGEMYILERLKLSKDAMILFYNIKSIYSYSDVLNRIQVYDSDEKLSNDLSGISIIFIESILNFTKKTTNDNDFAYDNDDTCSPKNDIGKKYIFSDLTIKQLAFIDVTVDESTPICPLIFYNSKFDELVFYGLKGNLKYQDLKFDENMTKTIDTNIKKFSISNIKRKYLDELSFDRVFNFYLLEKTVEIDIDTVTILYIDDKLLKEIDTLRRLKLINFNNDETNKRTIFSDLKWIDFLNKKFEFEFTDENVKLFNKKFIDENMFKLNIGDFTYLLNDDKYLCLINKFSEKSLVLPIFKRESYDCTCGVYTLYDKFKINDYSSVDLTNEIFGNHFCFMSYLITRLYNQTIIKCTETQNNLKCEEGFNDNLRDSCFPPYCSCIGNKPETLTCKGFESFDQLQFDGSNMNIWRAVKIIPSVKLQLNNQLKLSNLKFYDNVQFYFENLESIYAYSNVFRNLKFYDKINKTLLNDKKKISIEFSKSNISFIQIQNLNEITLLQEYTNCRFNDTNYKNYLFSNLDILRLSFTESEFPNTIILCPLLFNEAQINSIYLSSVSGAVRFRNVSFGENDKKTINSKVYDVVLNKNQDKFIRNIDSSSFFNELIFETLNSIYVYDTYIDKIDDDSLQKLKRLNTLSLKNTQNPNSSINIFNDTKWLENLKKNSKINIDEIDTNNILNIFETSSFNLDLDGYENFLTDENLCLITKIPTQRMVFVDVPFNNCSCASYWLYRYFYHYDSFIVSYAVPPKFVQNCYMDKNEIEVNNILNSCNVEEKCNLGTTRITRSTTTTRLTTTTNTTLSTTISKNLSISNIMFPRVDILLFFIIVFFILCF